MNTLKEWGDIEFSVVVKPIEEKLERKVDITIEVQDFLDKFKDIISDGTPTTLPPQGAISHKIHFIQGDSLPKTTSYKMTHQKMQK